VWEATFTFNVFVPEPAVTVHDPAWDALTFSGLLLMLPTIDASHGLVPCNTFAEPTSDVFTVPVGVTA
jgi:hypothetical protein